MKSVLLNLFIFVSILKVYPVSRQEIVIKTRTPEKIQDVRSYSTYRVLVSEIWSENPESPIDSILFESNIKWNNKNHSKLFVFSKMVNDSLRLGILKRYNPGLDVDRTFSYPLDSVRKRTTFDLSSYCAPRIDLPILIESGEDTLEIYIYPATRFLFDDQRVNDFPVSVNGTDVRYRLAVFDDHIFYFTLPNGAPSAKEAKLTIETGDGSMHRDKIVKQLHYKDAYGIGDTLYINNNFYLFKHFDLTKNEAHLEKLSIYEMAPTYLSEDALKILAPYFSEDKDFLLVDFWGTWCAPCIASFPDMVELYKNIQDKYAFLGICFDEKENEEKAYKIYEENNIEWPCLFNDMSSPTPQGVLTFMLRISTFPTCMVIDKEGRVLLKVTGLADLLEYIAY